ncbi:siroheme synthase [Streptomyces sp. OM5714]|nr:siroheme synthase [Streptomyces sp. OM5714]
MWGPKLAEVTDSKESVCNEVGDQACAEHLTDIALVVGDLELAVNDAGGSPSYPRTVAELEKVDAAVDAYSDHECLNDENAGIKGSPCPDDAQTILTGGQTLVLALQADEGVS